MYPHLQSPFGAAKPRERVIAERAGKSEEDVLKEEVQKEKIHVSLHGCAARQSLRAIPQGFNKAQSIP